ncbi:hypothetical protein GCM10009841_14750 [Microlunatus panaciterrae]|uniref:Protein-glutamine gamma-glutamyltransferase-like C-terminal domain-containing protein n=1 Tax=Microlunatus panaciterrae TaxID=400768 RepID=A0ABS2RLZ3_9ACTN|nr:DUF4129 domain-containing protein [Microlunatus panaciterrae]MBM7800035.1 hypothetical protein [Microlunatus panaciterrae]
MRLRTRSVGALVGVVTVLVLALLGAATGGSWTLEHRNFPQFARPDRPFEMPTPAGGMPGPASATPQPHPPALHLDLSWLGTLALAVGVLAAVGLLWWLWQRFRRTVSTVREDPRGLGAALVADQAMPDLPVLRQGIAAATRSLDRISDPNNAIVAAWLELEEAADGSGVTRQPAQTPTEFTVDVLARTEADPVATRELLRLYHRARFSSAGVGPNEVAAARACLGRLAASWTGAAPGPTP